MMFSILQEDNGSGDRKKDHVPSFFTDYNFYDLVELHAELARITLRPRFRLCSVDTLDDYRTVREFLAMHKCYTHSIPQ